MSWQDEIPEMIRYAIGDVDSPQKYTDARLQKQVVISANLIQSEVALDNTYTISISATGISPDPTNDTYKDNPFVTLIVLKSACMLAQNESRIYVGQSISVVDNGSSVDTRERAKSALELSKSFCAQYEDAKWQYATGQMAGVDPRVRFVVSPIRFRYGGNMGYGI